MAAPGAPPAQAASHLICPQVLALRNANQPSNLGVPNIFQEYLSRIHRSEDFDVLIAGLVRLLHVPIDSANTYLPGSRKSLKFFAELLFLLWRTIEINRVRRKPRLH